MTTTEINTTPITATELSSLSMIDRVALHCGLAMISWAHRPQRTRRTATADTMAEVEHRRELIDAQYRVHALR
ncbi:MAG TPA: hypothetical protein PLF56_06680 [Micropruina sp.]|mgnify:FL=1|nr:hypothetical protein [Micropruina sp.]